MGLNKKELHWPYTAKIQGNSLHLLLSIYCCASCSFTYIAPVCCDKVLFLSIFMNCLKKRTPFPSINKSLIPCVFFHTWIVDNVEGLMLTHCPQVHHHTCNTAGENLSHTCYPYWKFTWFRQDYCLDLSEQEAGPKTPTCSLCNHQTSTCFMIWAQAAV